VQEFTNVILFQKAPYFFSSTVHLMYGTMAIIVIFVHAISECSFSEFYSEKVRWSFIR